MMHAHPLFLLGDITGLLWAAGIALAILFIGTLVGVVLFGMKTFVADASSETGKTKRMTLLAIVAPFLAIVILWSFLFGF